jgi:hypothetical protein
LLAIEKLVNFCLLPSGSFTVSLPKISQRFAETGKSHVRL